ncbi:unnamed protein product, partial [Candidula unifasciata]
MALPPKGNKYLSIELNGDVLTRSKDNINVPNITYDNKAFDMASEDDSQQNYSHEDAHRTVPCNSQLRLDAVKSIAVSESAANSHQTHKTNEYCPPTASYSSTENGSFFVDRCFQIFDINSSGEISLRFLIGELRSLVYGTQTDKMRFLFNIYNIGGTGQIDASEIYQVLKSCIEESRMHFTNDDLKVINNKLIFKMSHKLYLIMFGLLIAHAQDFWKWFVVPGVVFLLEAISRISWIRSAYMGRTYIESVCLLPSEVTQLVITKPVGFTFKPGDFVYIQIPAIAKYEWHPFTISSAPEQRDTIWLHIRTAGYWTKSLLDYFSRYQYEDAENATDNSATYEVLKKCNLKRRASSIAWAKQKPLKARRIETNMRSRVITKRAKVL